MTSLEPRQRASDACLAFDTLVAPECRPRLRRRAELRAAVGRAALELSERRGFESVTVDEIARTAGVSRATFFRHFPRKESALFGWRAAWLEEFERLAAMRRADEPAFASIERAFARIGGLYQSHREHMIRHNAVVAASPSLLAHEAALDRSWEYAVVRAVSGTERGDDRFARWFGAALLGVLRAEVREWFEHDGQTDLVSAGMEAMRWLIDRSDPIRRREAGLG